MGSREVAVLCVMHSLMPVGLPGCLFAVVVIYYLMFYDWSECMMSVFGTTKLLVQLY